jgi:hypothetical protein
MLRHLVRFWATLCLTTGIAHAQVDFHPRIHAMGGVSAAVSDGIGAAFTNPANLMIRNHDQGFQFAGGWLSYQTTSGFDASSDPAAYLDQSAPFRAYQAGWSAPETDGRLTHARFDALVAGFGLTQPGFGLSLSWRIRGENTYGSGAGWYGTDPGLPADHHLRQNLRVMHEVGLGVAWEYELVSGWLTDLSKLFVGIQPKVMVPGMLLEQTLVSEYRADGTFTGGYSLVAAGAAAAAAIGDLAVPIRESDLFRPTGIGGGIDMGITYIIGLGNEQSLGTRRRQRTRNSIRISAAVSDLGLLRYSVQATTRQNARQTRSGPFQPPASLAVPFHGAPGQIEAILPSAPVEKALVDDASIQTGQPIYQSLPTLARVGGAVQWNRLLVAGDLNVPLFVHPYYGEERSVRVGTEISILRTIPLRAGAILQENRKTEYTAGMGLDFRNLALAVSARFRTTQNGSLGIQPVGAALTSLQIRF